MPHASLQQVLEIAIQRHRSGDLRGAENLYHLVLAQQPEQPDALHLLGLVRADLGYSDEGIELIRRALSISPAAADIWNNLGLTLTRYGRANEAINAFQEATRLRPHAIDVFNNLGNALQQAARPSEAVAAYRSAMSNRQRIPETDRTPAAPWELQACDNLMNLLHHDPANDARAIFQDHSKWNLLHAAPLAVLAPKHANERNPAKRLKVGYVSAYLNSYPIGRFLSGLLREHDHTEFEIFCYSDLRVPDALTEQLRRWSDHWRDTTTQKDEQLADQVRRDGIDVLVDLGMHATPNRMLVFARKPAPVQLTYLAYCSTTGLETIDYRLSDPYLDPDDSNQPFYSERTVRMPSYWCYPPPTDAPEVNELPAMGGTGTDITFGCLNDFGKVNPTTISMWSDILRDLPQSSLLLHAPTDPSRQLALRWFSNEGVEQRRIRFTGTLPMTDYFKQYHQIDLGLDPTPWCGGTTTCDALWMGVPVVTLAGRTAISRGGLSILTQIGLPELVAHTPQEYKAIACQLARNRPRLEAIRRDLRQRMQVSPLMNAPAFARNFEAILRRAWQSWCNPQAARPDERRH